MGPKRVIAPGSGGTSRCAINCASSDARKGANPYRPLTALPPVLDDLQHSRLIRALVASLETAGLPEWHQYEGCPGLLCRKESNHPTTHLRHVNTTNLPVAWLLSIYSWACTISSSLKVRSIRSVISLFSTVLTKSCKDSLVRFSASPA